MDDKWRASIQAMRTGKDEVFRGPDSPIPAAKRARFTGLHYFDPNPAYRFVVELQAAPPKRLEIPRSGGDKVVYTRVGHFALNLPGGAVRLAAYDTGQGGQLFIPFRDATSGKTTYGAGRYLEAHKLKDGRYLVDLNRAYHPFCAYDESYSCPFPPPENWLKLGVEAGERL